MPAVRWNITIEQGATFTLDFTIKQDGVAVNLTGYHARMQARRKHAAIEKDLDLTDEEGGGITLGGAAGTVSVRVEADATALIQARPQPGVWDFELEAPDGTVTRELEGQYTVPPEVTR
jgi:hypothetical protein